MTAFASDTTCTNAENTSAFITPAAPRVTLVRARHRCPQVTVPSPCVGVCKMDTNKGWCSGCYRTLDELALWSRATDAAKLAVWALVEQRQG